MSRKRCNRRPRPVGVPLLIATNRATRLTAPEVARLMRPHRQAFEQLRRGQVTQPHWLCLAAALNLAMSIEKQGVVRGLAEHLHAAELALNAIEDRAMPAGTASWQHTALRSGEMDAISTLLDLHQFQLEQLSYGEWREACDKALARVQTHGGVVLREASHG